MEVFTTVSGVRVKPNAAGEFAYQLWSSGNARTTVLVATMTFKSESVAQEAVNKALAAGFGVKAVT